MNQDAVKDKRINIRLEEDTYWALKKVVEDDLNTDISSYCRSLLWISTLHDVTVEKIKNAVKRFGKETDTENLEYMIKIKDEITFIEELLNSMRENRTKYDEFISMMEKWHETVLTEARKYYKKHNEVLDDVEKQLREYYGDEYDTDPTVHKFGGKINI